MRLRSVYYSRVHRNVTGYVLPAVSSRRGVLQGLLVLTGIYLIALALTEEPFFGDAAGFGVAAVVIVAAARFLKLEHPLMRLVIGMPLFGPWLLGAAVTKDTAVMTDMLAAGLILLVLTFVLLTPGRAETSTRGLAKQRLFRKTSLSYDEIAAIRPLHSRFAVIKGQLGFGSPNVVLDLFTGKRMKLGVETSEIDSFVGDVAEQIDSAEEEDFFFTPAALSATATAMPSQTSPAVSETEAGQEPAQDRQPAEPQTPSPHPKKGE